ncbi:hypothetical protein Tco_1148792 [Tanacetum coccineum]
MTATSLTPWQSQGVILVDWTWIVIKGQDHNDERGGSLSKSISGAISQDYRHKCEAAEAAYEAKRVKELGLLECKELKFLMIDTSSLPSEKAAYIERKQVEIMRKYLNA